VALAGMIAAVWGVYTQVDLFVAGWAKPEGWLAGLWWLAWLLEHAARLLIVTTVVPWVVMLLGVPLCEPLSMRVEQVLGGQPAAPLGFVREVLNSLRVSAGLLAVNLVGTLTLLALGFVPGVGVLAGLFGVLVWAPCLLALDLQDGALSRRGLGLRARLGVMAAHFPSTWALGLAALPLVSVPFLNLFGLPIAVVAGVLHVRGLEARGALAAADPSTSRL
jgi:CysZ protein